MRQYEALTHDYQGWNKLPGTVTISERGGLRKRGWQWLTSIFTIKIFCSWPFTKIGHSVFVKYHVEQMSLHATIVPDGKFHQSQTGDLNDVIQIFGHSEHECHQWPWSDYSRTKHYYISLVNLWELICLEWNCSGDEWSCHEWYGLDYSQGIFCVLYDK